MNHINVIDRDKSCLYVRPLAPSLLLVFLTLTGCSSSDNSKDIAPADNDSSQNIVIENTGWKEVARLVPPPGDDTYNNVTLSGDAALIGGSSSEDGFSGAVHYIERDGDGLWQNIARLQADDISDGDLFGSVLALSGNTALIASPAEGGFSGIRGAAYFFERQEDNQWLQVARIKTDIGGVKMAALEGDRALLGGSDYANEYSGAAYVYERQPNGVWMESAILRPSDVAGFDLLGFGGVGLALSGDTAMVSSPRDDSGQFENAGSVYVYERDSSGSWEQVAKLTASDAADDDYFGISISLQGDRAVIGQLNTFGTFSVGAAYIFERNAAGEWEEVTQLSAPGIPLGVKFGRKVSLYGNRVLVRASGDGFTGSGSAYLFERNSANRWNQVAEFTADISDDSFGSSLSLIEGRALISAPAGQGVVYVFEEGL